MRINLIPLYCWYVLVAAAMVLFAFPPLIAGSMMLELERAFHWPFFDPARGGDPLLWQHLFSPEILVRTRSERQKSGLGPILSAT